MVQPKRIDVDQLASLITRQQHAVQNHNTKWQSHVGTIVTLASGVTGLQWSSERS